MAKNTSLIRLHNDFIANLKRFKVKNKLPSLPIASLEVSRMMGKMGGKKKKRQITVEEIIY